MHLTFPAPGTDSLRALLPRVLTRIVQQYLALPADRADTLRHHAHTAARALCDRDAATLANIVSQPTLTALLGTVLHDGHAARADVLDTLDLSLLVELAGRDPQFAPVRIAKPSRGWPSLLLLSLGVRIDSSPRVTHVEISPRTLVVHAPGESAAIELLAPLRDAHHELVRASRAFIPLRSGVQFALGDNNPLTHISLHPERTGNTFDLGAHAVDEWTAALDDAFALIDRYLPEIFREMTLLLRTVVPVGYLPERHASCSYEDALGSIYLTLHPSPLKIAEALVHEFQHNKLHALMRLDPVLTNARTSRHRSPVRPDPRPLEGILLAVHAFIPVAMMYRRMTAARDPLSLGRDWSVQCEAAEAVYREGAATLFAHGAPTKTGRALLDEMRALIATLDAHR